MIDQFKLIYYYYYDFYYYYRSARGARGYMWLCVGVLGCRQQRVYVDVCGYTCVCAGVRSVDRCAQVYTGVRRCV